MADEIGFGGRGFESATMLPTKATRPREWSAHNQAREPRRAARSRRTTAQDLEETQILGIGVLVRSEYRAQKF